ncbi:MAG: hypothetical protein FWD54_02720 [Endomicrobia bacterium]|nr:hypothetical protein [Endomicrobiia bacterium]MCL2799177.1 hypothetical protein [Endomicrobiia bacterium]
MIKKTILLFLIMPFFAVSLFGVIYKKKADSEKESFFIYTDEKGVQIAKEKILKDGKTQFVSGVKISGEVKEFDEDGKLAYIWNYDDNELNGATYKFYPSGEKLYVLNYKNNELDGTAKKFYEDGTLEEKVLYEKGNIQTAEAYLKNGNCYRYSYKDNKLNGVSYLYDKNNRLIESSNYKNNILEGATKKYYLSGSIKSEMEYVRGKLDGYVRHYDEKGYEVNTLLYRDGKEISNMQELEKKDLKNFKSSASGQKQTDHPVIWSGPAQVHLIDSGRVLNELRFFAKNKNLNGKYYVKYRNGQIHYEGSFLNNKPNGVFKTYSPEGKIIATDTYSDGKLTGTSIMYYASGEKFAEFSYDNGKLNGKSNVYKKDGSLITDVNYRNGLMHGTLEVFYESGELCFAAYFSDGIPVGQLRYYFPEDKKLKYLIEFKQGKVCKSIQYSKDGFVEFEFLYDN